MGGGLLAIAGMIAFLFAQAPASTLDELAYHLAVPRMWVATGRVVELPLLSHSHFPFAIESASLPLLSFFGARGAIAAHFVHLMMAIAGTVLIAQRLAGRRWTLAAAIVVTPALLVTAGWAWVDFELTVLAAVLFLALRDHGNGRPGLLRASLALAGGLLTKYTFGPIALAIFAAAFLVSPKRRELLRAGTAGAVLGSFFFVRNLIETGNPFAPMFSAGGNGAFGYRQIATYIVDLRFVDEALGISMLLLVVAAVIHYRGLSRYDRLALTFGGALFVVLFLLAPSARILVPYLGVPALIGALTFELKPQRVLMFFVTLTVVIQLAFVALYASSQDLTGLLTGSTTEDSYLRAHRRTYADTRWISAQLPPHSRTLVIGSLELFWFDGDVRGGGNFDGPRIVRYLDVPEDVLKQRLRADGITHIAVLRSGIVPAESADMRRKERETVLPPDVGGRLRSFLLKQQRIASSRNANVFAVLQ
jgi:hypothetical protein